jgi:hypothetical protein
MYLSRQIFLALDPISSMHMGLTNDPDDQYRAELLSHFILRKIPNSIVDDPEVEDVFLRRHESQKYEHAKTKSAAELRSERKHGDEATSDGFASHGAGEANRRGSEHGKELWAKAKVADASNVMDVEDFDSSTVPFAGKGKPGAASEESGTAASARDAHAAPSSGQSGMSGSGKLPPLREMFCDPDKFWFRSVDVPLAESLEAYDALIKHRCKTAEDLVSYLDVHKEPRDCTCGAEARGRPHALKCHARQVSAWTGALRELGVPAFTANKVVTRIRDLLQ